jgi:hypothetical protein
MGGAITGLFKHQQVLDYTSEEMTAFETVGASADEINACFDKWARVLRSVGVPANATFVAATLHRTGLVGTRETRPHSDTIYNSDEVARVLGKAAQKYPWISYRASAGQAQAHDHSTRSSEHESKEERGARKWAAKGVMGRGQREQRRQERHDHITRSSTYKGEEKRHAQRGLEHRVLSYNGKVARICLPPKTGSTSFWVSHHARPCE